MFIFNNFILKKQKKGYMKLFHFITAPIFITLELKVQVSYQFGVHNEIRTHDLFLRREMLYPAELYGHS